MITELPAVVGKSRKLRAITSLVIVCGIAARLSVLGWHQPWTPHHPDEHILPLEAIALWEGITPREVGWPASTTRLAISAAAGAKWLADSRPALLANPEGAVGIADAIASWIGRQYVDPSNLYRIGRAVSLFAGTLQLLFTFWALSRWVAPEAAVLGTLVAALSPVAVLHSQYVLADMTGALFVTVAIGLAARPSRAAIIGMAALVGLAAASKFHFAVWIIMPLIYAARLDEPRSRRWSAALIAVLVALWVTVTLVPWFWTNPLLAAKEFLGVVVVKTGASITLSTIAANARTLAASLGWLSAFALPGLWRVLRESGIRRRYIGVIAPTTAGGVALLAAAIMFDRYALVLLPGVALLAAAGWEAVTVNRAVARTSAATALVLLVLSAVSLARAESVAAETDVDVLAKEWILSHVSRGARVAIHQEDNAFLPRTAAQLRDCMETSRSSASYMAKWRVEGTAHVPRTVEALRNVVLNDEQFAAYWCGRELESQTDDGFVLVPYHRDRRFGAVLESDVIAAYARRSPVTPIDVLVLNRDVVDLGRPTATLQTARGRRVIYSRLVLHP